VVVQLSLPGIKKPGRTAEAELPNGAAALVTIDSLAGPEPPVWPLPYAAVVSLRDGSTRAPATTTESSVALRFNPAETEVLFADSGYSLAELRAKLERGETLPNFSLIGTLEADLTVKERGFTSDNVLGMLPGF
jgi:hypothetical protein